MCSRFGLSPIDPLQQIMKKRRSNQDKRQQKWKRERATFENAQNIATQMKAELKQKGCHLAFYDFLDSYANEFRDIVTEGQREHASLLGIHEVSREVYENLDQHWGDFGYSDLEQVFYDIDESCEDYLQRDKSANVNGVTIIFRESSGVFRTAVFILKNVRGTFKFSDYKYVLKIPALLHELGHVDDIEKQINFNLNDGTTDIIEAEAYANLYALERMAGRDLRQCYMILFDALEKCSHGNEGYKKRVGELVIARSPSRQLIDWQAI